MRLSLPRRLAELLALVVSVALTAGFLVAGLRHHDGIYLFVAACGAYSTTRAGRVMYRDWKRAASTT